MKENENEINQKYISIAIPAIGHEEWTALEESFSSGWLTQGPKVQQFEVEFAKRHQVQFAIATTSCTTALHLALLTIGIQSSDIVLVPSFTWIATANVVEYCGGIPIFVDSNLSSYNIDPENLRQQINQCLAKGGKPKAIIVVHLFGLSADMDPIIEIAKEYELKLVEDAACAVGSLYKGTPVGGFGDIGCFSFHPRKNITTGEGGMCTTRCKEYADMLNCLRNHGASQSEEQRHHSDSPYLMPDFNILGFNYRMTDLQGAIGLVQLSKLDTLLKERQYWAEYYTKELAKITWLIPPRVPVPSDYFHSWQAYVCLVDESKISTKRNEIMEYLHCKGIGTRPGTHAIHELEYYRNKYNIRRESYPNASQLSANTIALPLHNRMKPEDYQRVVDTLKEIY